MWETPTPQGVAVQMANAAFKFFGYGSIFLLGDFLVPGLFPSIWTLLATTLVLTTAGVIGDTLVLPRLGNTRSLALGAVGIVLIIWLVPNLWPTSGMTIARTVVLAVFILPLEYALHRWLLRLSPSARH